MLVDWLKILKVDSYDFYRDWDGFIFTHGWMLLVAWLYSYPSFNRSFLYWFEVDRFLFGINVTEFDCFCRKLYFCGVSLPGALVC